MAEFYMQEAFKKGYMAGYLAAKEVEAADDED